MLFVLNSYNEKVLKEIIFEMFYSIMIKMSFHLIHLRSCKVVIIITLIKCKVSIDKKILLLSLGRKIVEKLCAMIHILQNLYYHCITILSNFYLIILSNIFVIIIISC